MALDPNDFSPEASNDMTESDARKKRLSSIMANKGGLSSLFAGNSDVNDLSKDSLNGGDTSSPIATPGLAANEAPGSPSLTATERVNRAANFMAATPLLSNEDRAGAAFSEAERGEEGVLGSGSRRMSTADRNKALFQFFRPSQSQDTEEAGPSDLQKAVGSAKSAYKASGGLRKLFAGGGSAPSTSADFSGGTFSTPGADQNRDLGLRSDLSGVEIGGPVSEIAGPARERGEIEIGGPASEVFGPSRETSSGWGGPSSFIPDFGKLGTYGSGLGLLGSLASLYGNASGNPTMAKAGGAAGVAGSGVNAIANPSIASGAGALGAGLGLAGNLSGNKNLAFGGNALGGLASLYSLGANLADLAPIASTFAPTLYGAAEGAAGAGAGAAAGAGAGAGAGAAAGAAPAAASLGVGATAGLAGGVLAIPGIVDMILRFAAPEMYGQSRYQLARDAANQKAQYATGTLQDLYGSVPANNMPATYAALRSQMGERGAVRSYLDPGTANSLGLSSGEFSQMSPQEFVTAMNWISEDPSRLSAVKGSGDIGYLDQGAASGYGGQAAEQAKILIAKQLGLPYAAAYGIGPAGSYSSPEDIRSEAEAEQRYQALRDQWQQAHPGTELDAWSPQFYGKDFDQLARDAEVRRAYGLSADTPVTPSLMDLYLSRLTSENNSNTL
jgi:hypothetical protein